MAVAIDMGLGIQVEVHLTPEERLAALRADVLHGLTAAAKSLPPKWFYDERGSRLFDQITRLPEYYPTRRERSILAERAGMIAALTGADTLVELGSGTSEKTRILLDAMRAGRRLRRYVAFDVCEEFVLASAEELASEYPVLELYGIVGDFQRHLDCLPRQGRKLVALLGSTLGNLMPNERSQFLTTLRKTFAPGDALLLGTDLIKDTARLEAAYDDAAGITAAFNRNVLAVLNRELGARFALERFEHVARFDCENEWIEMKLRSTVDQKVEIAALDLDVLFARGEELRTEISTKFRIDRLVPELQQAGFRLGAWWTDAEGDYALSLSFPHDA